MHIRILAAPALLTAALLACSNTPTGLQSVRTTDGSAAGDSTSAALPASVRVTGRILGVSATGPVSGPTDTLRFEPIPGARIEVRRNVLVNGQAAQELAATLSADAEGRFRLDALAGGHYIVQAAAPGSGYAAGWEYLPATRSAVEINLYLWKE
ncbi:MAG: carboxypeptidase-like regulatory domain-containing protein [Gemmatimonadales bacterium]